MASRAAPRLLTLSQRAAHSFLADATTTTSGRLLTRSRTHAAATQYAHAHAPPSRLTPQRRFQHTIPRFTGRNPFSANPAPQDGESTDAASNTTTSTTPPENSTATTASNQKNRIHSQPHYQLTFTCVPCGGRSKHTVSKQGYHHGSVLITCPECRNRHVISDHLGVFGDRKGVTVEDLMRDRGLLVKKGTLGEDGSIEFWEDDLPDGGAAEP
ncbi:DNL zinc finger domain-containing protein [Magnaporthiopsis poae ATCC 64411]|uniref:DNL zinc finger domain-containing protein n=1 Tax=Magnaporthiopsis poae (strain ATCC 64411 / 73-15) TaxID=644358 RepID=A0A0C4DTV7_MAGP6|nr:DNL zinc finger domain-containing protein [Magnaporthiopsis poae ATCC 64411]